MKSKETIAELAEYVKKNLSKGYTLESLRWALVSQGHSLVQVDKAVGLVKAQLTPVQPKIEQPVSQPIIEDLQVEPEEKKGFWARLFGS